METVAITKIGRPHALTVQEILDKLTESLRGTHLSFRNKDVLIKPNLCFPMRWETGATTSPQVVEAIVELVRQGGAGRVRIGEATTVGLNTWEVFAFCGYNDLASRTGVELVDLKEEIVTLPLPQGQAIKRAGISKKVLEADVVINVPVLKTHVDTVITCALKNAKGMVDDQTKRKLHLKGLSQGIVDLNTILRPALHVVDGLVGQEGLGPLAGTPVGAGILLVGTNPVATDSIAARIMNFSPSEVPHLVLAHERGLGPISLEEIRTIGENLAEVTMTFKRPPTALETHYPGFEVLVGRACSGCLGGFIWTMAKENQRGTLAKIRRRYPKVTIAIGPGVRPEPQDPTPILLIGNCQSTNRSLGTYLPGCPPSGWLIQDALRVLAGEEPESGPLNAWYEGLED